MSKHNRKSVSQSTVRLPMGILLIAEAFIEGFDLVLEFLLKDDEARRNQNERNRDPRVVIPASLFLDLIRKGSIEGRPGDGLLKAEVLADGSVRMVLATSTLRDLARTAPVDAFWSHLVPKLAVERELDRDVVAYVMDRIDMKVRHVNEESTIREKFRASRPQREETNVPPAAPKAEERKPEASPVPRVTVTDLAARLGVAVDTVREAMAKASVHARKADDSLPETVVGKVQSRLAEASTATPAAVPVKTSGPVVETKRPEKKAKKEQPRRAREEKKETTPRASSSGSFNTTLGDVLGDKLKLTEAPAPAPAEAPAFKSVAETAPVEASPATETAGKNGASTSAS